MSGGRIAVLDVLRGVAILGTLGTNIWIFTDPAGPAGFVAGHSDGLRTLLLTLCNGKFLGLLSIMFGVGMALQHASAQRRGQRWPGWYLWRSALLFVEGAVHFVLIFEFDVLTFYAVVSVLVAFLLGRSERVQRFWMIAVGSVHLLVIGGLTALLMSVDHIQRPAVTANTSSWLAQVSNRLEFALFWRLEAPFAIPVSTVLFLAGARLLRAGALEDSESGKRIQRRLMVWGIGVGLPLNLVTGFAGGGLVLVDRYVCAPLVAFGLFGLVTWTVHRMRGEAGVVRRGLTAVGKAAMSCYIAQNVIASALCYQWGLGLASKFDHLMPWWTVGCWLAISTLLMVLASLWLRRFQRGPAEAVLHWAYALPRHQTVKV